MHLSGLSTSEPNNFHVSNITTKFEDGAAVFSPVTGFMRSDDLDLGAGSD